MANLVWGVGVNDRKYPMWVNDKFTKEYALWRSFLGRCYNPKYQQEKPTYVGCSVSENFKSYSYFHEWVQKQIGFGLDNFHLDKDLLLRGNKVYSEDTCLFLPMELNALLLSSKAARGSFPLGVSKRGFRFIAACRTDKASSYIGRFDTPELAHNAYKQVKEAFIKAQAEKWKALIDPRAFAALMAYEVSITD